MAVASPLQDIDNKFCLCSICLEQLKEPKQLPCLHRYCKDCLSSVIQGSDDVIKCPECREEIQIPTNRVDGFKTDFYSKNLVEYVQIQQSLKSDEIRECYSCSKRLRVAAYCFKCNDFLCKDCHNFHVKNKTLKDHQKHTLSLEDIGAKNITVEMLASMRDAPRCHIHLEEISKLYCETCNNLPVCMACVFGEHKVHNLNEVKALAKMKRGELYQKLRNLEAIQRDIKFSAPTKAKEMLLSNVNIAKRKAMEMYDERYQKMMTKIQNIERRIRQLKQEEQNKEKKIFDPLETKMECEIQSIRQKYGKIFQVKKIEINNSFKVQESFLEKELAKLCDKRERFEQDKKELLKSIETQLNENIKIIETISEHSDSIKKRFETLNVMACSILASDNDWSAVQCIPDMCTAATNLMRDLKKDFPELTALTDVIVNYKQYSFGKQTVTKISEQVKRKITINDPFRYVFGMTGSGDGNIVLSGYTSDARVSFIIVIDMNGRVLKKMCTGSFGPKRYCELLSQYKVATVCEPNEIGLYDVRDGSYIKKNISDVINSWLKGRYVRCVATDSVNNHILVGGCYSRDVHVFDDQLNYLHILTLPEIMGRPVNITVSDGHLLVCDYNEHKCYVTTMDGMESKLVCEFIKPNLGGNNFEPISACTDNNGFVYMLWNSYKRLRQCYLVQYDHDGSHLIATRKVDEDAAVVTVVETSQGEKLVVATYNTRTVYLYDLITEDTNFV